MPPVSAVLDSGTAADGPVSANWTADLTGQGYVLPRYASNRFASDAANGFSSAYWNPTELGPDWEVFCRVDVLPTVAFRLYGGVLSPASAGMDGYEVEIDATNMYVTRVDNQTRVLLDNLGAHGMTAGDWLWLKRIASTLEASRSDDGVTWTLIGTSTDNTYRSPGVVGLLFQNDTAARASMFGGGSFAPAVAPDVASHPRYLLAGGVTV